MPGETIVNKWVLIRIGLIALNAFPLYSPRVHAEKTFSWLELMIVFVFSFGAVPLLGLMLIMHRRWSKTGQVVAVQWSRPEWTKNPFALREPSQFFHLAGLISMFRGISQIGLQPELYSSPSIGFLFLTCGIGLWIGTWLSVFSFKR